MKKLTIIIVIFAIAGFAQAEQSSKAVGTTATKCQLEEEKKQNGIKQVSCLTINMIKTVFYVNKDKWEENCKFYTEVLSLPYVVGPNKFWVEFGSGNCRICMHHNETKDGEIYKEVRNYSLKGNHIALEVGSIDNVKQMYNRIAKMDYTKGNEIMPKNENELGKLFSWGDKEQEYFSFWLIDPNGNVIQIETKHK